MILTITYTIYMISALLLLTVIFITHDNDKKRERTLLLLTPIPIINTILIISMIIFVVVEMYKDNIKEKMKNPTYAITHKKFKKTYFEPYVKVKEL